MVRGRPLRPALPAIQARARSRMAKRSSRCASFGSAFLKLAASARIEPRLGPRARRFFTFFDRSVEIFLRGGGVDVLGGDGALGEDDDLVVAVDLGVTGADGVDLPFLSLAGHEHA